MSRFSLATCFILAAASPILGQQDDAPADTDKLTAAPGALEHKAVLTIFEAWNTSHTKARAAITTATNRYRVKKEQPPPVVHYAAALVMMQIGAHAAPDVDGHLAKAGEHPLVSLAKSRIAIRVDDFDRAGVDADKAAGDKRSGTLGDGMKDAVEALRESAAGRKKGKSARSGSNVAGDLKEMIADEQKKTDAVLDDARREMQLLDAHYRESGEELVRLNRDLVWIQNQSVTVPGTGFFGYFASQYEKSAAISQCQQRIAAVEIERQRARVRHADLKNFEANEVAKSTWRMWSARLPWNVEDERKRLIAGKSAALYYGDDWNYVPSLPKEFPKQIPKPHLSKKKK